MIERRPRLARLLLVLGSLSTLSGLVLLLAARVSINRFMYVSEMGADGEPTAGVFRIALVLVAVGALLIAMNATHLRAKARILALWTPAASLFVAAGSFAVASQVSCTSHCPLPVGDSFTWQDLIHTVSAVLGFAAACIAMIQLADVRDHPGVAKLSLWSAIAVAVVAGTGGILSLARFAVVLGGLLEFVATTIALLWLLVFAMALVGSTRKRSPSDSGDPTGNRVSSGLRDGPLRDGPVPADAGH